MNKRKAIIFDLDNTLIDTDRRFFTVLRKIIVFIKQSTGRDVRVLARTLLEQSPGRSMEDLCHRMLPRGIDHREEIEKLCTALYYGASLQKPVSLFPGARALFHFVRQKGFLLFLVSYGGRKIQEQKVRAIGKEHFDRIYLIQGGKEKTFYSILHTYHCDPQISFVIGDKKQDEIMTGNHLGFQTIHFSYGRHASTPQHKKIEKPDYTVYNMRELHMLLKQMI